MELTRGLMKLIGPVLVIAVGFILGALIWKSSPGITGEFEPWDAKGFYYPGSLFLAGVAAALLSPRHFWLAPVGVYIGQFVYLFTHMTEPSPFWPIGMAFGVVYCGMSFLGAACVFACWKGLKKPRAEPK